MKLKMEFLKLTKLLNNVVIDRESLIFNYLGVLMDVEQLKFY